MTQWLVLEAYDDRYYTTGVTYQADNQPEPTTVLGPGVDVSVLPIIGLPARSTGASTPTTPPAPTASTRRTAASSARSATTPLATSSTRSTPLPRTGSPGVSGHHRQALGTGAVWHERRHPVRRAGRLRARPRRFVRPRAIRSTPTSPRTWSGRRTASHATWTAIPSPTRGTSRSCRSIPRRQCACLEGPLMGVQFGPYPTDQGTPDANFGAAVDGNYGFGDACIDGTLRWTDDPSAPAARTPAARRAVHAARRRRLPRAASTSRTRPTRSASRSTR